MDPELEITCGHLPYALNVNIPYYLQKVDRITVLVKTVCDSRQLNRYLNCSCVHKISESSNKGCWNTHVTIKKKLSQF